MIIIKTDAEIELMKRAGALTGQTLQYIEGLIKPGITTGELNRKAHEYITSRKASPTFLNYRGFPASVCISVDDVVVHGVPGSLRLEEGMIVSIDAGANLNGYNGDAARTFAVGRIPGNKARLIEVTRQCFFKAVEHVRPGARVGDISAAVQGWAEKHGYGVVRALEGHGIGRRLHEEPGVPNFGRAGKGAALKAGMTLAIEPMINMGTHEVKTDRDGWTCRTADGQPSAHYENTVLVTENGYELLTAYEFWDGAEYA
jgi:methionyl aminopeptidase